MLIAFSSRKLSMRKSSMEDHVSRVHVPNNAKQPDSGISGHLSGVEIVIRLNGGHRIKGKEFRQRECNQSITVISQPSSNTCIRESREGGKKLKFIELLGKQKKRCVNGVFQVDFDGRLDILIRRVFLAK